MRGLDHLFHDYDYNNNKIAEILTSLSISDPQSLFEIYQNSTPEAIIATGIFKIEPLHATEQQLVTLDPNDYQLDVLRTLEMYRNVELLKYRRGGGTTIIAAYLLIQALFHPVKRIGYQSMSLATSFAALATSIELMVSCLPQWMKDYFELDRKIERTNEGIVPIYGAGEPLGNTGSRIASGSSLRGQTIDILVLNELGKASDRPSLIQEQLSGSMKSVDPLKGRRIIDSTAGEPGSEHHRITMAALDRQNLDIPLGENDIYVHFWPAYRDVAYRAKSSEPWNAQTLEYKRRIESRTSDHVPDEFWNWWQSETRITGLSLMFKEHPCCVEDAFRQAGDHSIYTKPLDRAVDDNRVKKIRVNPERVVGTLWDMGVNDPAVVWMFQYDRRIENDQIDNGYMLLNFHQQSDWFAEDWIEYCLNWANTNHAELGTCFMPFDAERRSGNDPATFADVFRRSHFSVEVLTNTAAGLENRARNLIKFLDRCYFDQDNCRDGIMELRRYRYLVDSNGWRNGFSREGSHASTAMHLLPMVDEFHKSDIDRTAGQAPEWDQFTTSEFTMPSIPEAIANPYSIRRR